MIDLASQNPLKTITARENDENGLKVVVILKERGKTVDLTGYAANYEAANSSGPFVRNVADITNAAGGMFEYVFSKEAVSARGVWMGYFAFEKGTERFTTPDLKVVLGHDVKQGKSILENYVSDFDNLKERINETQETADTILEEVYKMDVPAIIAAKDIAVEAITIAEEINKKVNVLQKNWVSVLSFGAKGDGINDDTKAVQAAIDSEELIYFPRGMYLCGTLAVKSSTKLIGENPDNTFIIHKNTGGVPGFYSRSMLINANFPTYKAPSATDRVAVVGLNENITIENITFDGLNNHVYGLQFITSDYVKVKNCKVINTKGALDLRSVRYSYFNVECDNIKEDGISVTDQNLKAPVGAVHRGLSTRITFDGCVVKNSCTINGEGSSSMNAYEMDDGPSYIEYINCKAINNRGCGFEIHIHLPEFDLSNVKYINCVSIDNYPFAENVTRQVGGFAVGQTPEGSKMGNITYENCTSLGSPNAFCRLPGGEAGSHFNVTINGGTWQSLQAPSDREPTKSTCIYVGKLFKDMKIIGANIGGAVDGYGIHSYGTGDGLIIENCSFRDMYTPIRAGHAGGSLNISNVDILPGDPVGAASTACVYIMADRVNMTNMTLTVDSSKYNSSIMRLINVKSASVSAILVNTGAVGNNAFNTQDCENVTITGSVARGFTNAVMLSSTSQSVVVTGNSFKGCTNKFNSNPSYLVETGNAI